MTPLEHENATATVSISGLALGCYNKATQNYEVGFLRHECHALKIEVTKKLPDGEESVMMYEIKDNQHRIFIDAENAISPQDPIYFVGEDYDDFNRKQLTGDREDFRWVVDFETNLNGGEPVELKAPEVPVTEMYISKPRLYADQETMTRDLHNLIPLDAKGEPVISEEKPFGFFTEGVKADITCQDGGAVIFRVDGPQGFQVHLPHGYGPHQIAITNNCPPKEASEEEESDRDTDSDAEPPELDSLGIKPTDFRLFYAVIEDTAGEKYDVAPANQGEGAVCNIGGLTKSEKLFPLPVSSN
jgi:hypothetical protein